MVFTTLKLGQKVAKGAKFLWGQYKASNINAQGQNWGFKKGNYAQAPSADAMRQPAPEVTPSSNQMISGVPNEVLYIGGAVLVLSMLKR